ncbi:sushi, von Willebrand factor type A, EGF and pentraxin domain-containing protein 1-like isoform X2 [Lineus longissimus]|uniref:sushi, von Willebrand factor type A, EGF and pentraxin domain-containing protein 1-like isoform X2 n=1 Tax=Lineus longissimus TaxID=88925 RepID=UPI00315D355F
MSCPVETALCVFIALICVGFLSAMTLQDACGPLPDVPFAMKPRGQSRFTEGQELEYGCRGGYQRRGNRRIRCSNNQWEWVDPNRPFSCRIVICPPPPQVVHGSYPGHDYSFGNILTMRCDEGYKIKTTGLDHIICQPNRRWTVISAWCEAVTCRPLAAPQYGSMTLVRGSDSLVVGTAYSFECDREHMLRGYRAREKMERECRPDGTWDNVEAECIDIQCPVLDRLENGIVDAVDNHFGAIATFDCNNGYDMIPHYSADSKVTYCQRDGKWSVTIPECKPNHCGALPPKANALFGQGQWFSIGVKKNYGCNHGYTYRGSPWISCTHDGWVWDTPDRPFYCQENCGPPGNSGVAHAKSIQSGSYRVNEVVNMECEDDYTLRGETEMRCTEQHSADGTPTSPTWVWTNPENKMKCHEKCHDPTLLANIKLQHRRYDIGRVFTLECDNGYSPGVTPHNSRVQCSENNRWSWLKSNDPPLSCHANCRDTPNVAHAIKQGATTSYPIGHPIAMACARGYKVRGNNNLRCTTSGWMWLDHSSRFSCKKESIIEVPKGRDGFCPRPVLGGREVYFYKETSLAALTGNGFKEFRVGTTLRCVCSNPGEMFMKENDRRVHARDVQCLPGGSWQQCNCDMIPSEVRETPRIRIRSVGYKVLPDGAMRIPRVSNIRPIYLDCEFVIWRGGDYNGDWLHPDPYGFQFDLIAAGERFIDTSISGLSIMSQTLKIKREYGNDRPDGTYNCTKVIIWYGNRQTYHNSIKLVTQDPYRDVCCPSLAFIADGSMELEKGRSCNDGVGKMAGSKWKFQCDDDFTIEGDEYTHCLNDGTWSHPPPTCRLEVCKHLPFVKNGQILRRNRDINDVETVEMKCLPEFSEVIGSNLWKCEHGWWVQAPDQVPLRCEKEFCEGFPFVRDQHCAVLERGESITKREQLFTGEQLTTYHLAGSEVVEKCTGTTSAWVCRGRKWESVRFCQKLPSSLQTRCTSLEIGATLSVRDSWMARGDAAFITYYTAASKLSSNCSGTDQKWLCDNGQWARWTNCDELPTQLTIRASPLKLHSSEARDVTSWADGQTIKVECLIGYSLKTETGDSWTCDQGTWKQSRADLDVPECTRDMSRPTSNVGQGQWCDPDTDIPSGSVITAAGDYGNYDDNGKTVIEVECNNGARVNITCISGSYDPEPSQACI